MYKLKLHRTFSGGVYYGQHKNRQNNTLHHKAQSVGLTEEEKKEQAELRKEYIATIKMNLRNQLDNIDVKEADGTVVNLGERYGRKKTH